MTITKEHTIEALEWCIDKWESILNGDRSVANGSVRCELCTLFRQNGVKKGLGGGPFEIAYTDCKKCPLQLNGFGCLGKKSCWSLYNRLEDWKGFGEYTIHSVPDPQAKAKLLSYARLMLRHLEICLENLNNG